MADTGVPGIEEVLEPDLPIVDCHHHLWDRPGGPYLLPQLLEDIGNGHRVVSTVFVQCRSMYREGTPEPMAAIGETEFVNGIAAMSASGQYGAIRACSGIVGAADMMTGEDVRSVLEAHVAAGNGRFRGIRQITAWDSDPALAIAGYSVTSKMLEQPAFRKGLDCLAALNLSFDALVFHHQLSELTAAARACPETTIIVNHLGLPLGVGPYASRRSDVFDAWRHGLQDLASCPNVMMKVGGLSMGFFGLRSSLSEVASSVALAAVWKPFIETAIEAFGADRCMLESNFPVDKVGCSYTTLWNAFKHVTAAYSPDEKADLYHRAAQRAYRLAAL